MEHHGACNTEHAFHAFQILREAIKRIPDEFKGITFFSIHDVWLYQANPIPTTCVACLELAGSTWLGSDLRGPFKWLEILDVDTIHPWTHPNCNCRFHRQPPVSLLEVP